MRFKIVNYILLLLGIRRKVEVHFKVLKVDGEFVTVSWRTDLTKEQVSILQLNDTLSVKTASLVYLSE